MSAGPDLDASPGAPDRSVLPPTKRGRWLVVAVLLLALLARVAAVAQSVGWYEPRTDALHFDYTASSIASGDGYGYAIVPPNDIAQKEPTALRAPAYPYALAAVYVVFGEHSWTFGRLLNAGFGTLAVALLGVVVAQVWNRRMAWIAMAMAAVHPALLVVGASLQLEPLLASMILATLAAALAHRRRPRGLLWPVVAGVCAGTAVLTRETGFLALPPVAWLIWTSAADGGPAKPTWSRRALVPPLVTVACAVAVVLPWTIRNAVVLDEFVPVTTSSGIGLSGTFNESSMNDEENPAQWRVPESDPALLELMLSLDDPTEVEVDRALRSASIDLIREHPGYLLKATFYNTQRLFDLDGGRYARDTAKYIPYSEGLLDLAIVASYVLYVLAIAGICFRRRILAQAPGALWAVPVLLLVFIAVLLPANIRYRYLLEPFFIMLAVPVVAMVVDRIALERQPS